MPDTRTLRQKLEAMAERGTEHEAAIARTKLAEMGEEPPNRPPTRNAAAAPMPEWYARTVWSNNNTGTVATGTWFTFTVSI